MTMVDTAPDSYTPGEIPEDDRKAPPSVWMPGDVHHTHEQIYEESPAGVQAANAVDPRDTEIMRLNAELAAAKAGADADPRDVEIAELKRQLGNDVTLEAAPEVKAAEVDPRDAEIAELKAQLASK